MKKNFRQLSPIISFQWTFPLILALFISSWFCEKGPLDEAEPKGNSPGMTQDDRTGGLNVTEEEFWISALFTDIGQFKAIHPAYSAYAESDAPWGFKHEGIDLITADSACVLVPADGEVRWLELYLNPVNNLWQVNIHIEFNDRISYNLMFEPRANTEEEIAIQRAAIRVNENDRLTAGDTLGTILNFSIDDTNCGNATVHFDIWVDGQNVCPEPYFKPEALADIMTLLHNMYPDGQLCYPPSSTTSVKGNERKENI